MKAHTHFALLCTVLLATSSLGVAQLPCTQEMIRGTWVDLGSGFALVNVPNSSQPAPVPLTGFAIFKIDGQGNVAATGINDVAGQVVNGWIDGTIKVNPDCTATANFTSHLPNMPPLPGVEAMVVVGGGNEMWSVQTKGPLGQVVDLEKLRRISVRDPHCSSQTARGRFGLNYQGFTMLSASQAQPTPVPISFVGTATVDGQGDVVGGGTYSVGGNILNVTLTNATLKVNSDCTGTMQYSIIPTGSNQPLPAQETDELAVLKNGDEILLVPTQGVFGPPVILGSMKREIEFDARFP